MAKVFFTNITVGTKFTYNDEPCKKYSPLTYVNLSAPTLGEFYSIPNMQVEIEDPEPAKKTTKKK